ncbi:hypothetical protein BJ684DRAFT_17204 [Piptocephalis cylindrospora]|uniref:Uncharacterized protein n=1 Tax=Piptocephalis cylindrospora TaxID=1907219 RepID=A0A4P9Y0K9_9FUNG|nr:hypothetical protein BJ684DRAFT_17204 [Piptocephalis cylindrospora]|eukprot:RKP12295.1 hypothetical protein BJ684DRAFT_17204 [Piptocephalis cylindrospora]
MHSLRLFALLAFTATLMSATLIKAAPADSARRVASSLVSFGYLTDKGQAFFLCADKDSVFIQNIGTPSDNCKFTAEPQDDKVAYSFGENQYLGLMMGKFLPVKAPFNPVPHAPLWSESLSPADGSDFNLASDLKPSLTEQLKLGYSSYDNAADNKPLAIDKGVAVYMLAPDASKEGRQDAMTGETAGQWYKFTWND